MVSYVGSLSPLWLMSASLVDALKKSVLTLFPFKQQMGEDWYRNRATLLYIQYEKSIYKLAYSYLNNSSDAEDILQETLIKYLEKMPYLQDENHEKAWLLRVAANLSLNRIKYNKVRETSELSEELVQDGRNDLSYVWEAVRKLPLNYRDAIHLYYLEGYATKEIAYILKRNESTIRSDLKRGREQLKDILKEEYGMEGGL